MSSPAEEFQMFLFLARFLFAFSFFSLTMCSKVFPTLAFSLLFFLLVALSSPGNSCVLFNPFSANGAPVECLDDDTLNLPGSSFWRTLTIENVRILNCSAFVHVFAVRCLKKFRLVASPSILCHDFRSGQDFMEVLAPLA